MIDTHAHLNFKDFAVDFDQVLQRAKDLGVKKIINIACDEKTGDECLELAEKYENLYSTVGVHPYDSADLDVKLLEKWQNLVVTKEKIIGVGETGLDYFKCEVPKDVQKKSLIKQVEFALKNNLPLIIHNREADSDVYDVLSDYLEHGKLLIKAVFHCYGSNLEFAEKLWKIGAFTSFTGIITYPKSDELRLVVKNVPLDMFMLETDCPFLAPQSHRGQTNEPSFVVDTLKYMAELHGMNVDELERVHDGNAERFFDFKRTVKGN